MYAPLFTNLTLSPAARLPVVIAMAPARTTMRIAVRVRVEVMVKLLFGRRCRRVVDLCKATRLPVGDRVGGVR
jgi:hypothetical protein